MTTLVLRVKRRMRRSGVVFVVLLALAGALGVAPSASAATCPRGQVVLLHDLAQTGADLAPLAARLRAAGWCTSSPTWGRNPPPGDGLPGGMTLLSRAGPQVAAILRAADRRRPLAVVAHGRGGWAAVAALRGSGIPVRTLVTVGGFWDGTTVLGLATAKQFSRDVGAYPFLKPVEEQLLGPYCASCSEALRGSDELREQRARGLLLPGVRQVNVVSRTDGMVAPWSSGTAPGMQNVVVQDVRPASTVNHYGLRSDPDVAALVVRALGSGS